MPHTHLHVDVFPARGQTREVWELPTVEDVWELPTVEDVWELPTVEDVTLKSTVTF
jgi:hypothetical protein